MGLIYILICQISYPQRCAHACLEELQRTVSTDYNVSSVKKKLWVNVLAICVLSYYHLTFISYVHPLPLPFPSTTIKHMKNIWNVIPQFSAKAGEKATTAKNGSLDRTCGSLLQKICQKYDNLTEVDKLASVTKKVETVKLVMQENVDLALQNCVKLETIERAAGESQGHEGLILFIF